MAATMRKALDQAGLEPRDIGYVNAHGTSTALNDLYEAQAIAAVFGADARTLPVSSTKPVTGHCLAAAAGVEAVIACKALAEGIVPPTGNLTAPDPAITLDLVAGEARRVPLRHVMSNAFAFGGHNGVCIFSRPE
jgi:3-oxoacyl-(acyl-carrier-protein) synthase